MDQDSSEPREEPTAETSTDSGVAMETTTTRDEGNSSTESEPESEPSPVAADIVAEVRELYRNASKLDVLIRLVQSRTVELRYQRQLQICQAAFEEGVKEKTRLQLDLAYYDKMLAVLQRGACEAKSQLATVTQQHGEAVRMVEKLDLKRTELIREEQLIKAELAGYREKFEEMQREMQDRATRFEADRRRCDQLQVQLDKLTEANKAYQKTVSDSEVKQRSMVSAHSARLNEMENLRADLEAKLKDAQDRIEREQRANALLKEHTDTVLQEKTQLAMDLAMVENRIAAMEADFNRETAALEAKWKAMVEEETARMNDKIAEMVRATQELTAEKDSLVAKLAKQKEATAEMEAKLGGMQTILDDRNNEIFSLHSKINAEQKRFEEAKQQHSQETAKSNNQLSNLLKESTEKDSKIARLEQNITDQNNALSTIKSQLASKDAEINQLKEQHLNVNHYQAEIRQLEAQLEKRRASTETGNLTAQITSTPASILDSSDELPAKRSCVSPSYSTFQGSVQRRSFFKRSASVTASANLMNLNLNVSSVSTVNVDDEPMDLGNLSSVSAASSSVRPVKPFFRREKK
uniref:(northern house mosquito) hypothetical protein n=2 Tax=Culex pipiens TaxID=7175 RepID=A0A8D8EUV4_CULPI